MVKFLLNKQCTLMARCKGSVEAESSVRKILLADIWRNGALQFSAGLFFASNSDMCVLRHLIRSTSAPYENTNRSLH